MIDAAHRAHIMGRPSLAVAAAFAAEREAEIAERFGPYLARMARARLEPLSFEGFRYASLTPEERLVADYGPEVAATLLSGQAVKGTFERAYMLAVAR